MTVTRVFGHYDSWTVRCACGWRGARMGVAQNGQVPVRPTLKPCPSCGGAVKLTAASVKRALKVAT